MTQNPPLREESLGLASHEEEHILHNQVLGMIPALLTEDYKHISNLFHVLGPYWHAPIWKYGKDHPTGTTVPIIVGNWTLSMDITSGKIWLTPFPKVLLLTHSDMAGILSYIYSEYRVLKW